MATIKCDSCDWKTEVEFHEVPAWHNKQCPECSSVLIDDEDMEKWELFNLAMHHGLIVEASEGEEGAFIVKSK